uniref:Uncharacterized protein n=1 Tax=Glossina austeni TaxID=7395 RepID=A0A1A9VQC1_GLOAU
MQGEEKKKLRKLEIRRIKRSKDTRKNDSEDNKDKRLREQVSKRRLKVIKSLKSSSVGLLSPPQFNTYGFLFLCGHTKANIYADNQQSSQIEEKTTKILHPVSLMSLAAGVLPFIRTTAVASKHYNFDACCRW